MYYLLIVQDYNTIGQYIFSCVLKAKNLLVNNALKTKTKKIEDGVRYRLLVIKSG